MANAIPAGETTAHTRCNDTHEQVCATVVDLEEHRSKLIDAMVLSHEVAALKACCAMHDRGELTDEELILIARGRD